MKTIVLFYHQIIPKEDIITKILNEYMWGCCGFYDKPKAIITELYDLNDEQINGDLVDFIDSRYKMTPREIIQKFINEQAEKYPDIWLNYNFKKITEGSYNDKYFIPDFKTQKEYDLALKWEKENLKDRKMVAINVISSLNTSSNFNQFDATINIIGMTLADIEVELGKVLEKLDIEI